MTKKELQQKREELHKEYARLLDENVDRRKEMVYIAEDFFIKELLGERDAKEEYKELYYRARETHEKIIKLKQQMDDITKQL